VTICHHTHSAKNPFVTITVSANALPAHLKHGDTVGACSAGAARTGVVRPRRCTRRTRRSTRTRSVAPPRQARDDARKPTARTSRRRTARTPRRRPRRARPQQGAREDARPGEGERPRHNHAPQGPGKDHARRTATATAAVRARGNGQGQATPGPRQRHRNRHPRQLRVATARSTRSSFTPRTTARRESPVGRALSLWSSCATRRNLRALRRAAACGRLLRARAPRAAGHAEGFTRTTTVVHLRGGGAGGASARTSPGTPSTTTASRRRARSSRSRAPGRSSPSRDPRDADTQRRWPTRAPRSTSRCARRARRSRRRSARAAPRDVRRLAGPRRLHRRASVVRRWLEIEPSHRFKLDPAATGRRPDRRARRDRRDRDGRLQGVLQPGRAIRRPTPTSTAQSPRAFPRPYLEDPALTDETDSVLEPYRERVTWDAPIQSVADVEGSRSPRACSTPSPRASGRSRSCSTSTTTADETGIDLYGGGMFELGPGRGQIQYLASLLSPLTARTTSRRGRTTIPSRVKASVQPDRAGAGQRGGFAGRPRRYPLTD
jgi:hypothetical protein